MFSLIKTNLLCLPDFRLDQIEQSQYYNLYNFDLIIAYVFCRMLKHSLPLFLFRNSLSSAL